jgi:hypothetical protein
MAFAAKLDDFGKPAWIAVMVLGFIVWWPIGLAILGFILWSGRMGCGHGHWGRWRNERWERRGWEGRHFGRNRSGNSAFDEYRAETLRRLEDEQKEFMDFLQRLRHAKDKAEFDEFMAERRNRPQMPPDDRSTDQSPQPSS